MDEVLAKLSEFRALGCEVSFSGNEVQVSFEATSQLADESVSPKARLTYAIIVRLLPRQEYSLSTIMSESNGSELQETVHQGTPRIVREGVFLTLAGQQAVAFDSQLLTEQVEAKLAQVGYSRRRRLLGRFFSK